MNRDDIRASLYGTVELPKGRFNQKNEKITRDIRDQIIIHGLAMGRTVISDDTNLVPSTLQGLKDLAGMNDGIVEIRSFLNVPFHECIHRDEQRQHPVGASVIRKMWQEHIFKPIQQDPSLPPAVICDLDGTLAVLNGRDPYDASTCDQDGVNENVLRVLNAYKAAGTTVVFVSGRQQKDTEPTLKFLARYGFRNNPLFMRETNDTRRDSIIKHEIYDNYIKDQYRVVLAIDDRDQVVDLWRGLGIETWQVAMGAF